MVTRRYSAKSIIEVSSAVFDDGSFEGESLYAMTFLGYQKGRKAQLEEGLICWRGSQTELATPLL